MSIAQSLLPEFDQEMATTRRLLERVADDRLEFKPHDKSMTFGRLASHVAELPGWTVMTLKETSLDMSPVDAPPYVPPIHDSRASMLATFDGHVAAARAAIEASEDAAFFVDWTLKNAGQELFTLPRLAVLRIWVFNHIIHHRGQLSVYLRENDIPVPSIYGPSADES